METDKLKTLMNLILQANDKITHLKEKIDFQVVEISKTESMISKFEECLKEQNKVLLKLTENKVEITAKKREWMKEFEEYNSDSEEETVEINFGLSLSKQKKELIDVNNLDYKVNNDDQINKSVNIDDFLLPNLINNQIKESASSNLSNNNLNIVCNNNKNKESEKVELGKINVLKKKLPVNKDNEISMKRIMLAATNKTKGINSKKTSSNTVAKPVDLISNSSVNSNSYSNNNIVNRNKPFQIINGNNCNTDAILSKSRNNLTNDQKEKEQKLTKYDQKFDFCEPKNREILKILKYNGCVYICGSDGLLCRYRNDDIRLFETNCNDDVIHVVVSCEILIACTSRCFICFHDHRSINKAVKTPFECDIINLSTYDKGVYIALNDGQVYTYLFNTQQFVRSFHINNNISSFIKLPDGYITIQSNNNNNNNNKVYYKHNELPDYRGANNCLIGPNTTWLCNLGKKIIISCYNTQKIVSSVKVGNVARLINFNNKYAVVVDQRNFINLYKIERNKFQLLRVITSYKKTISAIYISSTNQIFVAYQMKIFTIKI